VPITVVGWLTSAACASAGTAARPAGLPALNAVPGVVDAPTLPEAAGLADATGVPDWPGAAWAAIAAPEWPGVGWPPPPQPASSAAATTSSAIGRGVTKRIRRGAGERGAGRTR
jgi:hypothetical protein